MNSDTLANLDLISREIEQKDMEKEDIIKSAAYRINLARFKKQYPQFPAPTCMVGISGQWGRGKSTLFILLLRLWMEFDLFNEVYFFSGSGTKDPKMKHFFPHDNKNTHTTPENILSLLKNFEEDNPENKDLLESIRAAFMPKAPTPSSKSKKNPVVAATAVKTGSGVSKRTVPRKKKGPRPEDEVDAKFVRNLIKKTLRSNSIKVSDIDSEHFENMSKQEQCRFLRKMVSPGKICFFDDSSGDKNILSQNSPIYRLVVMLRHLGACCAFAYHSWKDLPRKMRKQTSTNIVFPCPPEEQEAIGAASNLGAKTMEHLLTAMGRIPHVYLVIHDRAPADEMYWINFRVPLSESTIAEIVSAEELFRKSQRGSGVGNGFGMAGGDSSSGGSAIVQSLLDEAPEIDVLNKDRPLPSDQTLELDLTSREQKYLPEARLLVAKVENFTYPLLPDPAKHLKKAAPPRKRRAPSTSSAPPTKRPKTTSASGTAQLLPSSHPMKDPIRPSSAQARTAAAHFLHPSAVIANLARNRAIAAGGRGIAAGDVAAARASGDLAATRAAVARQAAAKRNPKIATQIAKSTTGRPNTMAVAAAFRRGLLQGIRTSSRLSSRGLGPRGAAQKAFKQAQGGVRRNRGAGGGGRAARATPGTLSMVQDLLSRQEKLTQAQITARTQAEEIRRLKAEQDKLPTAEELQARTDEAIQRALKLDEENRRSAREEELLKGEAEEAEPEPFEPPQPDQEMGDPEPEPEPEEEPEPEVVDTPMGESDPFPEHPRNIKPVSTVSTGTNTVTPNPFGPVATTFTATPNTGKGISTIGNNPALPVATRDPAPPARPTPPPLQVSDTQPTKVEFPQSPRPPPRGLPAPGPFSLPAPPRTPAPRRPIENVEGDLVGTQGEPKRQQSFGPQRLMLPWKTEAKPPAPPPTTASFGPSANSFGASPSSGISIPTSTTNPFKPAAIEAPPPPTPAPSGPSTSTELVLRGTGPSSSTATQQKKTFTTLKPSNVGGLRLAGVAKAKPKPLPANIAKDIAQSSQAVATTAFTHGNGLVTGGHGSRNKSSHKNTIRPQDTTAEGQLVKYEASGQPVLHQPNSVIAPPAVPEGTSYVALPAPEVGDPNSNKRGLEGDLVNPLPPPKRKGFIPFELASDENDSTMETITTPSEVTEPADMTDE